MIPQFVLRVRLHQASASTLRPLCDDTSDTSLIENNGLQSHSGVTPLFSMRTVLLTSSQSCRIAYADARYRCRWALRTDKVKVFYMIRKIFRNFKIINIDLFD